MGRLRASLLALALFAGAAHAQSGSLVTVASRDGELCFENMPREVYDQMAALAPGFFVSYPAGTTCPSVGVGFYAGNMDSEPSIRVYTSNESNAFELCASGSMVNCAVPAPVVAGFTDLWWNPAESGWGLSITHHTTGMAFLAWYIYDGTGDPKWYVAPACRLGTGGRTCTDTLYETKGPPFPGPFDPARVTRRAAGTITLRFTDLVNGSFTYTLDGVTGTKTIRRQSF